METRAGIVLLALIVIASGCGDGGEKPKAPTNTDSPSKGLEVSEFRAADSTLTPGQQTQLILVLKNHNNKPVNIDALSLLNTGDLEVLEKDCGDLNIKAAREGIKPVMQCSWDVRAPSQEALGAFESKTLSFNLNLEYGSTLTNTQPLKIEFKSNDEIDSVSEKTLEYSNSDISMTLKTENPAPLSGRLLEVNVKETGPGNVKGDYSFDYTPSRIFDCPPESEIGMIDDEASFSCTLEPDSASTRNLFLSTHYKYAKAPTLDIEVVKP